MKNDGCQHSMKLRNQHALDNQRGSGGHISTVLLVLVLFAGWIAPAGAGVISVPNASFEAPETAFADPRVDAWQKTPKPVWYDEGQNGPWDQLVGVFRNTAPGTVDHIDNCDGAQALFLFALPEVGMFQDYDSTDWSNSVPTHAFDAKFEVGKAYTLTVGVIGGGGGMTNGVTLMAGLYYRDAASNRVTVAATSITNDPAIFTNTTHFIDFQVQMPVVREGDTWAGQQMGVQFLSTVNPVLVGGYWDLDHVRLSSVTAPVLTLPVLAEGRFSFTVQGDPGSRVEVLASADLAVPLGGWSSLGTLTNLTGNVSFSEPVSGSSSRFYALRQLP